MSAKRSPYKLRPTLINEESRRNILNNIGKFSWAREIADNAVKEADKICDEGFEYLWSLMTSQELPRSAYFRNLCGCLNCGELTSHYTKDHKNSPWKCVCPKCGCVFPTNDFASYYESSLDESGRFVPGKGDKRFLKNIFRILR